MYWVAKHARSQKALYKFPIIIIIVFLLGGKGYGSRKSSAAHSCQVYVSCFSVYLGTATVATRVMLPNATSLFIVF